MKTEKLFAEYSLESKKKLVEEIFKDCNNFFLSDLMNRCQDDFKLCSLVGYKLVAAIYDPTFLNEDQKRVFMRFFNLHDDQSPIMGPLWVPVRYCGGNMAFGRVFAFNHCAFSSKDSIVGLRDRGIDPSYPSFKILKGLRYIGHYNDWAMFKLDPSSTDDMTGMLYTLHEKNFTIEFAHFPHEGGHRTLFRWEDS